MTYVFLQCVNEACRFRFPAPAGETAALVCPRCRSSLTFVAEAERCAAGATQQRGGRPEVVGLLDNIRSIHNVGSIFRSADGAGVAHLHLAGITATPDHPRLAKAALGAHETVCWTYHTNALDAAQALRAQGYRLLALEPAVANSAPFAPRPADRLATIVGNERAGVDPGVLALCDTVLSLPMSGRKTSLNAAVAFGIGVYYLRYGEELATDDHGKG